jgi:hypothetical protein
METIARIGICGDPIPHSIKQQILLFDKIVVPDLKEIVEWCRFYSKINGSNDSIENDLLFLHSLGIVCEPDDVTARKGIDHAAGHKSKEKELLNAIRLQTNVSRATLNLLKSVHAEYHPSRSNEHAIREADQHIGQFREYAHLCKARIISKLLLKRNDINATTLVSKIVFPSSLADLESWLGTKQTNAGFGVATDIITMTLSKIPMPDEGTSLKRILDFRNDPESRGYLFGLRSWLGDVARQGLSAGEAEEKLEWLLFQQEQHLRVHRIASTRRSIGAVFVASAEILEDLVRMKWTKAAKGIVSIVNGKMELLKSEISGPAKEITYIIRARREFQK